ncbi:hypothetical protein CEXT_584881 [Caerostris extrusa]|uniref:Uncharacterized protein n=1 Tax=Caerostris extrusa TaxID=172846 RepID=A0AAV4SWQ1_CAEEX|nr:hypothetical protein CEXT_584881 [Caerostris extrusa]
MSDYSEYFEHFSNLGKGLNDTVCVFASRSSDKKIGLKMKKIVVGGFLLKKLTLQKHGELSQRKFYRELVIQAKYMG